jgi:hypothetical protein
MLLTWLWWQVVVEGDVLRAHVAGHNASTRVAVEGFFLATEQGASDAIGVQPRGKACLSLRITS